MCTVSMIGDGYRDQFPNRWPDLYPPGAEKLGSVTRAEFEALKQEVEELKKLLLAAKEFDEKTGQPDCEIDEKVELIKKIAEMVGVDMDEVFGK